MAPRVSRWWSRLRRPALKQREPRQPVPGRQEPSALLVLPEPVLTGSALKESEPRESVPKEWALKESEPTASAPKG